MTKRIGKGTILNLPISNLVVIISIACSIHAPEGAGIKRCKPILNCNYSYKPLINRQRWVISQPIMWTVREFLDISQYWVYTALGIFHRLYTKTNIWINRTLYIERHLTWDLYIKYPQTHRNVEKLANSPFNGIADFRKVYMILDQQNYREFNFSWMFFAEFRGVDIKQIVTKICL